MMKMLKACCSLFRIRMAEGLQYRAAAISSLTIGIFWGIIECVVYNVFYKYGSNNWNTNGMTLENAISYVWLAQSLLILQFMSIDGDIMDKINNGDVGVELCRPLDLYFHWLFKSAAGRLSTGWIRLVLTITIGFVMPFGYALSPTATVSGLFLCIISACFAFVLCASFGMLMTAVRLNITWGNGPTYILMLISGVLSGAYLPLRLWPDFMQGILRYQPFGGFVDIPAQLYIGTIMPKDAFSAIFVQIVWIIIFLAAGRFIMRLRLKSIIVQGG